MRQDDIVQTYAPDKQKLAELVIAAKGNNRTMAQYSIDTEISAPTLSRIANGKINGPLSMNFIEKIYNKKCKEADFSFDTLLLANGMVRASVVERGKNIVENALFRHEYGIELERHAKNAIINAVIDRGVTVQGIHPDYNHRKNEAPFGIYLSYDFCLSIPCEKYKFWYFDVICGRGNHASAFNAAINNALRLFVLDSWSPEFLANQKTSLVFENRTAYERFIMRFKGAPIRSAISAILINAETEEFIEETWMSATPEELSVLAMEPTHRGDIAVWEDEDLDEYYDFDNEEDNNDR